MTQRLGEELGPRRRDSPRPEQIALYSGGGTDFTDLAHAVGRPGILVPGPMLAAYLEQFVRGELPGWRLERLTTTFRLPTATGDTLVVSGAITEHHQMPDGERIVCDLIIAHAGREQAVTGTATLWRPGRS